MESARDKHTREIVEAEDLWLLDSVDTEGYVCWGCGITMHPAAWEKDKKVRAYFKKWICPYISRHLLSLNPLLACCRRYSR
ncbi:hypothetical protein JGC42_03185, partial [Salmonella enterica subsp. enterica serovar Indiana]|nr:hypothetical protein [Salmonella enterica subsp. enterica serovar Indiana]MBJ3566592.1 hypothetical protein [Salmonella enterica subsp. enterica serovar Indiana]